MLPLVAVQIDHGAARSGRPETDCSPRPLRRPPRRSPIRRPPRPKSPRHQPSRRRRPKARPPQSRSSRRASRSISAAPTRSTACAHSGAADQIQSGDRGAAADHHDQGRQHRPRHAAPPRRRPADQCRGRRKALRGPRRERPPLRDHRVRRPAAVDARRQQEKGQEKKLRTGFRRRTRTRTRTRCRKPRPRRRPLRPPSRRSIAAATPQNARRSARSPRLHLRAAGRTAEAGDGVGGIDAVVVLQAVGTRSELDHCEQLSIKIGTSMAVRPMTLFEQRRPTSETMPTSRLLPASASSRPYCRA